MEMGSEIFKNLQSGAPPTIQCLRGHLETELPALEASWNTLDLHHLWPIAASRPFEETSIFNENLV